MDNTRLFMSFTAGAGTRFTRFQFHSPTLLLYLLETCHPFCRHGQASVYSIETRTCLKEESQRKILEFMYSPILRSSQKNWRMEICSKKNHGKEEDKKCKNKNANRCTFPEQLLTDRKTKVKRCET